MVLRPVRIRLTMAARLVALVVAIAACTAWAAEDWELVTTSGKVRVVWFSRAENADRQSYDRIIAAVCSRDELCIINFWSHKKRTPRALPMGDAAMDAQVSYYTRNPFTHYERFKWNCRLRKEPDCFH